MDNHHSEVNAKALAFTNQRLPCKHIYGNHRKNVGGKRYVPIRCLQQTVCGKHVFFLT